MGSGAKSKCSICRAKFRISTQNRSAFFFEGLFRIELHEEEQNTKIEHTKFFTATFYPRVNGCMIAQHDILKLQISSLVAVTCNNGV